MFIDYWWVFILVIFVIMIVCPTKVKKRKNRYIKKELEIDVKPVLTNINKLAEYFII